ncbi:MAG: PAS domain S-box protein [Sulfuricellaceae bacterium]|nr:PAS domain S-box protein [Sulfuricellaceae bacterium]
MTVIKKIKHNRIWIIAFLVIIPGLIGLYVNGLKQGYDEKLARAATDSQNMARVLEEQINSVVQKTDILLQHAAGEIVLQRVKKLQANEESHAYLKMLKASIPEIFRIRIIQSDGYSLASSLEENAARPFYGDRAYFIRHRDNPALGLDISEPIIGRTHKGWQIMLSRRLDYADGSFAGIVSSVLALSYFENFFSTLDLGKDSDITLLSADLHVITRFPISESQRMKSVRGGPIDAALQINPSKGTTSGKSSVDGTDRIYSYRQVGNLPLIVVVGLSRQEVLAEWRRAALIDGAVILALLVAIGWLTFSLMRRYKLEQDGKDQLREITSTLGEGIYVLDRDGRVTFMNPEAERLLGWTQAELLGRRGHETFHYKRVNGTPISAHACPVLQTLLTGQSNHAINDNLVRKDGTTIPVSIISSPIIRDGEVVGSVASFQDITPRLEVEKALREGEARFRLLFNSGNDAILVHLLNDTDGRGKFVEVNDVACRRLGYSRDELLQMSPVEIDDPESTSDIEKVMKQIQTHGFALFERVHVTKRGEKFPVEISSHVFEMDGRPLLMSVVRDISERKLAMATQDKLERDQRALLDAAQESALLLERDGTILAINHVGAKRLHGTQNELLGQNIFDLIPPEVAKARRALVEKVAQNGLPGALEDERNGMRMANSVYPVIDVDGEINRVAVYSVDVTEQRLLEAIENLFSAINQKVLRGEVLEDVLQFICAQVAQLFSLDMAWLGHKEPDGTVSVLTSAGNAKEYAQRLGTVVVRWDEGPLSLGPTGTAIRTKETQTFNSDNPGFQTWAAIAHEYGLQAVLGIPLTVHGEIYGAFTLYSCESSVFTEPAMVNRLVGIASRISMALEMGKDQQELRLLSTALASAANAVMVTDHRGCIQWANAAFSHLSGYSEAEIIGQSPRILKSGQQDSAYYQALWRTIGSGEVWSREAVERNKDGSLYTVMQTITPLTDAAGKITHFIAIHEDISDQKRTQERISHMAQYDELTDLPNRALFYDRLHQAFSLAKRSKVGLALMFLDLDRFKQVNDTLGHHIGDLLLKNVAQRLRQCVRESDIVARLGGDEFTVLLYNLHDQEDASRIAEKIIAAVSQPYELDGREVHIGVSIGIARFTDDTEDEDGLVALADKAMYAAKAGGRNTYRFCVGEE